MNAPARRVWIAVAATAACAALLPGGVAAARPKPPPLKTIGTFASVVQTDGVRYWAVTTLSGATRVTDERKHASFTVQTPAGYALTAVGGGRVLWSCWSCGEGSHGQSASRPLVMTIATREFASPPNFDQFVETQLGEWDSLFFTRVGANWLAGEIRGYHDERLVYMNWRTGQTLDPFGARATEDLNAVGLRRPLCKPLRRKLVPAGVDGEFPDRYLPAVVERRYTLLSFFDVKSNSERVELGRCGSRHRIPLSFGEVQLGAGIVTGERPGEFQGPAHVVALVPRTGRRSVWHISPYGGAVQHAGSRLFVSAVDGDNHWKVSSARIPRK